MSLILKLVAQVITSIPLLIECYLRNNFISVFYFTNWEVGKSEVGSRKSFYPTLKLNFFALNHSPKSPLDM